MTVSTKTAEALWFEGPRLAVLKNEEVPPPKPSEVQVRALHSLVSAGSEMNLYRGEGNLPDLLLPTARGTLPFPLKFAYQTVGEVVAVGEGAKLRTGDHVFALHPHQSLFNIPELPGLVLKIPPGVDLLRAQLSGMFGVSLHVFLQRPVRPGEIVAVSGLGMVGMFCAYLARLTAGRLVIVDPLPERRRRAAWIGADRVVAPAEAADTINELSDGRGVDMFIETSGAPAALQSAIVNTATLGTVAVAAWYGTRPLHLSLSPEFHLRSLKIISIHVGNLDESNRWDRARKFQTSLDFLARVNVGDLITHRIPFRKAPSAYELLDKNSADTLGVLLEY